MHNENGIDLVSVANLKSVLSKLVNNNNRLLVDFNRNYMKQGKLDYYHGSMINGKLDYYHGSVINICLVYALEDRKVNNRDFTAQNCLFGAVEITKNINTSHYRYNGYGICFDGKSSFSFGNRTDAKNVIILGANMSFSIMIILVKIIFMF